MKDGRQQIWSTVFLSAPIAVLVVFMITAVVACFFAQTATSGYIPGIGRDTNAVVVSGASLALANPANGGPASSSADLQGAVTLPFLHEEGGKGRVKRSQSETLFGQLFLLRGNDWSPYQLSSISGIMTRN